MSREASRSRWQATAPGRRPVRRRRDPSVQLACQRALGSVKRARGGFVNELLLGPSQRRQRVVVAPIVVLQSAPSAMSLAPANRQPFRLVAKNVESTPQPALGRPGPRPLTRKGLVARGSGSARVRELSSARATPFPLVQPGLHVADAHSAAADRVDDRRWRLGAARVPRAATPLGVEAEQTTAERRAATVMRVGDPARGRRDRHRSLR